MEIDLWKLLDDFYEVYWLCQEQPGMHEQLQYNKVEAKFNALASNKVQSAWVGADLILTIHPFFMSLGNVANDTTKFIEKHSNGSIYAWEKNWDD